MRTTIPTPAGRLARHAPLALVLAFVVLPSRAPARSVVEGELSRVYTGRVSGDMSAPNGCPARADLSGHSVTCTIGNSPN